MIACSKADLLAAAKCYACIPEGKIAAVLTYLLCRIKKNDQPTDLISWEPASAGGFYNAAIPFANLAAFRAIDPATVTALNLSTQPITSLTNLSTLPNLATLSVIGTNLVTLLLVDCPALFWVNAYQCPLLTSVVIQNSPYILELDVKQCALTALDVSDLVYLQTLDCTANSINTLDVTGCVSLVSLDCSVNTLAALDVSNLTALYDLDCSSNTPTLVALSLAGCPAIKNIEAFDNAFPSAVVDAVLADLVTSAVDNGGSVNISGGATEAPSAAGLISKAALEAGAGGGWTVAVTP
jgi:hypothetical protein